MEKGILVINIGSTSSKIALYRGRESVAVANYNHSREELKRCESVFDQIPLRAAALRLFLDENHITAGDVDLIVPRYPFVNSRRTGNIMCNSDFIRMAESRQDAFHVMFITPLVAWEVFGSDVPMAIPDVMANVQVPEVLQITGVPQIRRSGQCHVENIMAVTQKYAYNVGKEIENVGVVVGHMGGGVSTAWVNRGGIRYCMFDGEAGFSPERGGNLPSLPLIDMCFGGEYTKNQITSMIRGAGGLAAHLGTTDCVEVERRIQAGDEKAKLVYDAMIMRMVACIGETAAIAGSGVERILLTGGIANSTYVTGMIREHLELFAPVTVYAGEYEMDYFAGFGLGVLEGRIPVNDYELPEGYDNK